MRTPANITKHPIHPVLVAIPIGLWVLASPWTRRRKPPSFVRSYFQERASA